MSLPHLPASRNGESGSQEVRYRLAKGIFAAIRGNFIGTREAHCWLMQGIFAAGSKRTIGTREVRQQSAQTALSTFVFCKHASNARTMRAWQLILSIITMPSLFYFSFITKRLQHPLAPPAPKFAKARFAPPHNRIPPFFHLFLFSQKIIAALPQPYIVSTVSHGTPSKAPHGHRDKPRHLQQSPHTVAAISHTVPDTSSFCSPHIGKLALPHGRRALLHPPL